MTTPSGKVASGPSAAALPGCAEGLLTDVHGQPDARLVGGGLEVGPLGGSHPQADGLARVVGGGSSGSALLRLGHATRIRHTETLDQPELPCNDNCMSHTVITTAPCGTRGVYEYPTASAALDAFHEFALAGVTVHRYSSKGNVLNGYRAEQGPVVLRDGVLVFA